jgi:hypothetical protein
MLPNSEFVYKTKNCSMQHKQLKPFTTVYLNNSKFTRS